MTQRTESFRIGHDTVEGRVTINMDASSEGPEMFEIYLTIIDPSDGVLGTPPVAVVTIYDASETRKNDFHLSFSSDLNGQS